MNALKAEKQLDIRFSEVDSMNVVWHGNYPLYLEDAREFFGLKYGLSYQSIFNNGYFAPIVKLNLKYIKPLRYGMKPIIEIIYRPTQAAKICFDYVIYDSEQSNKILTAESVQVFTDTNHNLVWDNPEFYLNWKEKWKTL